MHGERSVVRARGVCMVVKESKVLAPGSMHSRDGVQAPVCRRGAVHGGGACRRQLVAQSTESFIEWGILSWRCGRQVDDLRQGKSA